MRAVTAAPRVPVIFADLISVAEAAEYAGVSGETIRRWCDRYGIGRRPAGNGYREWAYQVSLPGLRMVVTGDFTALEAFRSGDRTSAIVAHHFRD